MSVMALMVFFKARNHTQPRISDASFALISSLLSYSKFMTFYTPLHRLLVVRVFHWDHLRIMADILSRQFSFKKLEFWNCIEYFFYVHHFEITVWNFRLFRQRIQDVGIVQCLFNHVECHLCCPFM